MDLNKDDEVDFEEFQKWLHRERERRGGRSHMRMRTAQLLRRREARKTKLATLLRSVEASGTAKRMSHRERRLLVIRAAASLAGDNVELMSKRDRLAHNKLRIKHMNWLSSTCFEAADKAAGEEVALLAARHMMKLLRAGSEGMLEVGDMTPVPMTLFEDPDFGPDVQRCGPVMSKCVWWFGVVGGQGTNQCASHQSPPPARPPPPRRPSLPTFMVVRLVLVVVR